MIAAATGFHARYIVDNGIGPGAVIGVIRSGDVIPYITRIERPAPGGPALPPESDYEWVPQGQPAKATPEGALDIRAKVQSALTGLVHFFNTLDVPGMGEGLVVKLYAAGFTRIEDYVRAAPADFMRAEGIKERIAARLHTHGSARAPSQADFSAALKSASSFSSISRLWLLKLLLKGGCCEIAPWSCRSSPMCTTRAASEASISPYTLHTSWMAFASRVVTEA